MSIIGTVASFNRDTSYGVVEIENSPGEETTLVSFHSTSHHGGFFPYVGQRVEVFFNSLGDLLALHPVGTA